MGKKKSETVQPEEQIEAAGGPVPSGRSTRPPADNNVQDVLSAIDGYTCGPVRALAQDPPQNSADAQLGGSKVSVVYQMFERTLGSGESIKLLTITDSGTSGLNGPILSAQQLEERQRQQGQLVIKEGENWAAWEAMRYTKSGQDSLGSRGQGKYAYLWHSAHPAPGSPHDSPKQAWRMIVLYDSLLPGGEYRLGVRYHNPATRLIEPPYLNQSAKDVLREGFHYEQWDVPLGLEPLTEPGTRVIIPFLGAEAQEAIRTGELRGWLTAEWWRKIQKNELAITIIDEDGVETPIGVPAFWENQRWKDTDDRYLVKEDVPLPSDGSGRPRRVKRIVLFADDSLQNDDLDGPAQFNGVQILRGGQWITTLEMREFADVVPKAHRAGFRGFVELERGLEHEFRAIESPAHDGFDRRTGIYKELKRLIEDVVEEFASRRGWITDPEHTPEAEYEDLLRELADMFVGPTAGVDGGSDTKWSCSVDPEYPADRPQVNWGDRIRIYAQCKRTPAGGRDDVSFTANIIRPDGSQICVLGERHQRLSPNPSGESATATVNLGDLFVERGWRPADPFKEPGRYSIRISCFVDDKEVAAGRAFFYVA